MRAMTKRSASALLWFAAMWVGYEIAWSLFGVPRIAGPIIAGTVSAFVALDPLGLFWPRVTDNESPAQGVPAAGLRS